MLSNKDDGINGQRRRQDDIRKFLQTTEAISSDEMRAVRNWMRSLLNIWVQHYEPSDETGDDEVLLLVLEEIMKDSFIFLDFWITDINQKTSLFHFVQEKLLWFPYNTDHFFKISEILSGNKVFNFVDELVKMLSNIDVMTFKFTNFPHKRAPEQDRELFAGQEIYQTTEPIPMASGISIPQHCKFYFCGPNKQIVHFLNPHNFWHTLWQKMTHRLNLLIAGNTTILTNEDANMFKFLCHLLLIKPNVLESLESLVLPEQQHYDEEIIQNKENLKKDYMYLMPQQTPDDSTGATIVAFLMDLLSVYLEIEEPEHLILSVLAALHSLLNSQHRYTTQKVLYWSSIMREHIFQANNVFVEIAIYLDGEETKSETFPQKEKSCLEIRILLLQITKSLFTDDAVVWTQLRDIWRQDSPSRSDEILNRMAQFETTGSSNLSKCHEQLIGQTVSHHKNTLESLHWGRHAHLLNELFGFVNIRDFTLASQLLQKLVEHLVIPVSDRVLKNGLTARAIETPFKYRLMSVLHETCTEIAKKLEFRSARSDLNIMSQGSLSIPNSEIQACDTSRMALVKMVADLHINELLIECFEVRVSHSSFQNRVQPLALNSKMKFDNKHWIINVVQKRNEFCATAIRHYLVSGLNLLSQTVRTGHSLSQFDTSAPNPLADVVNSFCVRDSIYKYRFQHANQNKAVNILVAVAHLLNFDGDKGFRNAVPVYRFGLNDVKILFEKKLFNNENEMLLELKKFSESRFFNRAYDQGMMFDLPLSKSYVKLLNASSPDSMVLLSFYRFNLNIFGPYRLA